MSALFRRCLVQRRLTPVDLLFISQICPSYPLFSKELLLFLLLSSFTFISYIRDWNPDSSNCVWHEAVNLISEAFIEMFQMCGRLWDCRRDWPRIPQWSGHPLFPQPAGLSAKVMHVMVLQSTFSTQPFLSLQHRASFSLRAPCKSPVPKGAHRSTSLEQCHIFGSLG